MLCEEEEESEQPEESGHGKHGHALVREVRAGRTECGWQCDMIHQDPEGHEENYLRSPARRGPEDSFSEQWVKPNWASSDNGGDQGRHCFLLPHLIYLNRNSSGSVQRASSTNQGIHAWKVIFLPIPRHFTVTESSAGHGGACSPS